MAIDDIIDADFTAALQGVEGVIVCYCSWLNVFRGVDAVIHVASPVVCRGDTATTLDVSITFRFSSWYIEWRWFKSAVLGSKNVLLQAIDLGIKRFSVTGSISTAMDPVAGMTVAKLTENGVKNLYLNQPLILISVDYSPVTREQAYAGANRGFVYYVSKVLAERAVNEIGAAYPDVSIAGSES